MSLRMISKALPVLVAVALIAGATAAHATPATEAIRTANDRLRELLAKKAEDQAARDRIHQQVTSELQKLLDIGLLGQRALVDHWEKMTAQQRTAIQTTLQSIVEKNYLSQLRGNLDYQIDYVGEEKKGEDILVRTLIRAQQNGRPSKISVDYRLHAEGDHWRIFDIVTEDVSILQNYRTQFNRIIAKDGVDGLIGRMKSKLERTVEAP